jgi:hypothetical protein
MPVALGGSKVSVASCWQGLREICPLELPRNLLSRVQGEFFMEKGMYPIGTGL